MNYDQMIGALQIFRKYERREDQNIQPAHDEIYAGTIRPDKLSQQEVETLRRFGWRWNSALECWSINT